MSWKRWTMNFVLSRLAKAAGYLDPVTVFANLQRFSKPTEVWVPTELLRSGAVLQARGLINSQAIQHNLDWVWPFWVERQFNPRDVAFIPRAFSITHINLTHRNWTAVGLPDYPEYPIVDPRGMVTPLFDGWSIEAWIIGPHGALVPSRLFNVSQYVDLENGLSINTLSHVGEFTLESRCEVKADDGQPVCEIAFKAASRSKAWVAIAIRPYNPEGVSFIHNIKRLEGKAGWLVNGKDEVILSEPAMRYGFAHYGDGDVFHKVKQIAAMPAESCPRDIACQVGMATAIAIYDLSANGTIDIIARVPLAKTEQPLIVRWTDHLRSHCVFNVPDDSFKFLYDMALRTLVLHSPKDVYPGPFTYKRFWFRDAAFIIDAMLAAGLHENLEKIIDGFGARQNPGGYFLSQDGEWDSNGQALWTIGRYCQVTNRPIKPEWVAHLNWGAKWIMRKRTSRTEPSGHMGLLPAGFSAEHFGPSDFYYWDDFWGAAGLRAASRLIMPHDADLARQYSNEAEDLMGCVEQSLRDVEARIGHAGIPCSPYRRMDEGAIGSIVASYPLQLWGAQDQRILDTVDYLIDKCFLDGGFYHALSHSGINAYLTMDIAQVLLRAGDDRFFDVAKTVARLASPTGQWPEAIHPQTYGGCMGDGQHVWAAAEWILLMRNMFVRIEEKSRTIVLCSGIPEEWLKEGATMSMGETPTIFGPVYVSLTVEGGDILVSWRVVWHEQPGTIEINVPGYPRITVKPDDKNVRFKFKNTHSPVEKEPTPASKRI